MLTNKQIDIPAVRRALARQWRRSDKTRAFMRRNGLDPTDYYAGAILAARHCAEEVCDELHDLEQIEQNSMVDR